MAQCVCMSLSSSSPSLSCFLLHRATFPFLQSRAEGMSGWNRWDCCDWDWVGGGRRGRGRGHGSGIRPPFRNSPMSRLLLPPPPPRPCLPSFSSAAELTLSPLLRARSPLLLSSVHSRSPPREEGGGGGGGSGGRRRWRILNTRERHRSRSVGRDCYSAVRQKVRVIECPVENRCRNAVLRSVRLASPACLLIMLPESKVEGGVCEWCVRFCPSSVDATSV